MVEDVISNVREAFLDEGVDEQVLQELKQVSVRSYGKAFTLYICKLKSCGKAVKDMQSL